MLRCDNCWFGHKTVEELVACNSKEQIVVEKNERGEDMLTDESWAAQQTIRDRDEEIKRLHQRAFDRHSVTGNSWGLGDD